MTLRLYAAVALTLAAVPCLAPVSAQQTAERAGTIPLSVHDGGAVVVPVTIGGAGPYRFLLDTGSTRSAISARLARQFRSPVVAQTAMVTPAGHSTRNVVLVRGLQVGLAFSTSVAAMVLPDDALRRAARVDGLLGQDILANRSYTIDYRRRELIWHDDDIAHVRGHRLPLTVADGLYFVSLPTTAGPAGPVRLVADSGADALVFFGGADGMSLSATPKETGLIRTSVGLHVGRRISLDQLDLGGLTLRDQPALLLAERESTGLLGDGLLPLHLFARVTFDGSRALIVVTR